MLNRLSVKQSLLETIAAQKHQLGITSAAPITDTQLDAPGIDSIDTLTTALEDFNPFPRPLLYSPSLLQGIWQLIYSNAREIRSLTRLPFGFQLGAVYQVIDVASGRFFNQAFCQQSTGLVSGHVAVTATFEIAPSEGDGQPDRRVNVFFDTRSLFLDRALGIPFAGKTPLKTFDARNPPGRNPYLMITYLDEEFRIGRGGEGSLFILKRAESLTP